MRHDDRIAIMYGNNFISFIQLHNCGDELIRNALYPVAAYLVSGNKTLVITDVDLMGTAPAEPPPVGGDRQVGATQSPSAEPQAKPAQ